MGRRQAPVRRFFEASRPGTLTDDVNGYRQEGFAKFDRNVHRGRRLSASRAYLHPVMNRPNLDVHTLAQVTGLRTQGNRVVGVDYQRAGGAAPQRGGRRGDPLRWRDRFTPAAPAERHRREQRPGGARYPDDRGPAWGGLKPPGPPRGLHPARMQAARVDRAVAQAPAQAADRRRMVVPA